MNKTKREKTKLKELWFLAIYIEIVLLYTHIYIVVYYILYMGKAYIRYMIYENG